MKINGERQLLKLKSRHPFTVSYQENHIAIVDAVESEELITLIGTHVGDDDSEVISPQIDSESQGNIG